MYDIIDDLTGDVTTDITDDIMLIEQAKTAS